MAVRPPRACSKPGCGVPTTDPSGRCPAHLRKAFASLRDPETRRRHNERQPESNKFYKTPAWLNTRAGVLRQQPLCVECLRLGQVRPATSVDHIIPYRERPDLGLMPDNLRALCHSCHARIGRKVRESMVK